VQPRVIRAGLFLAKAGAAVFFLFTIRASRAGTT
jgi:hypothetical protein